MRVTSHAWGEGLHGWALEIDVFFELDVLLTARDGALASVALAERIRQAWMDSCGSR